MNNTIDIKIVSGCEGEALYINDYRVSGPKPWGGGRVVKCFETTKKDIARAINADMSWDELVEKAKELGYEYLKDDYGLGHTLHKKMNTEIRFIYATGNVVIEDINGVGFIFKESRTPSQMYQIMLALN